MVIQLAVGSLNYSVLLDNSQVHVDHIWSYQHRLDDNLCPEIPQKAIVNMMVLHDKKHSPAILVILSNTCPADAAPNQQETTHRGSHPFADGFADSKSSSCFVQP